MASTYSTNLAIELIGTGDQAGSWGNTTNTNLGTLIEQAISGYVTQAVSTGTDTTITIPNGATGVARNMYIELTGTGGASTNLIVPANKKLYFIFNNSTGAVTVKVSGQTGVSVPQGKKVVLTSNGTDIVNGLNYIADFGSNSATITQLTATSATITNLTLTSLVISNLSIASANITTLTGSTQTLSGNLTLSGGTANGVLYLNGSKVATSGSALTFDGTNLNLNSGTAVSATSGGSVTAGVFAARAPLSAHQTAVGVLQYSANETTLRSYGATGVTGALVFNLGAGGSADAEYMRLTSSVLSTVAGVNVGIGTATPGSYLSGTAKLVALANANSQNSILVRNDNAGSSASCAIALNASGNTWGIECGSSAKNSNALTFQLDYGGTNSTLMMLTSSGNLGIGTTSPGTRLDVQSSTTGTRNARFIDNSGVGGGGRGSGIGLGGISNDTGSVISEYARLLGLKTNATQGNSQGYLSIQTNDGSTLVERAVIDTSGNLGIGTSSPAFKLDVETGAGRIQFRNGSSTGGSSTGNGIVSVNTANSALLDLNYRATQHNFVVGANTGSAMVLDSSGNLGVGTTSPADTNSFGRSLDIRSSTGAAAYFRDSDDATKYGVAGFFGADSNAYYGSWGTGTGVLFYSAGSERARITAAGLFQLNQSADTNYLFSNAAAASKGGVLANASTAGYAAVQGVHSSNSATGYCAYFNNSGSATGLYISNTAAWQSTSDERLKTDIKDLDSTEKLMQLRPRDYLWKSQETSDTPDKRNFGFIAQEVQEVFPDLVGVSPDGMFSVEYTGLIAPLVKAVQELKAELDAAKVKIAALEAK